MGRKRCIPGKYHHRASGQLRVRIDGHDHYCGPWGTQKAEDEYARRVGEWLAAGGLKGPVKPEPGQAATMTQLADAYLPHAEAYYRDETGKQTNEVYHLRHVLRLLMASYGNTPGVDFGPEQAKMVRQLFVDQGWARAYCNEQMARLRRLLGWGVEHSFFPAENLAKIREVAPLKAGRTKARETEAREDVPDWVVDAVLPFMGPTVRAMIQVQRFSGMRPGEVCRLTPGQVKRDADPECWLYEPKKHKTKHRGKKRRIWFGPKAQAILLPLIEGAKADDSPLFPGLRTGKAYRVDVYNHHVALAIDAADAERRKQAAEKGEDEPSPLPRFFPHLIRHARLTEVSDKHGPMAAKAVGGHEHLNTTSIYVHGEDKLAKKAAKESG